MALGGETIGRAYIKVLADGSEFEAELGHVFKRAESVAKKGGEDTGKAHNKGFEKEHERGLRASLARTRAWVGLQSKEMSKLGDRFGRVLGKGSRNDFLNLVGSISAGIAKALPSLGEWASGINKAGSASSEAAKKMQEAGGGVSGLGKAFGIIGQVVAAAGMLKLMTSAIGVLGAAASMTTGLVLALAGSIGFALVGGLAAVAGAMVPFAAAIGVGALAMAGLQKMAKTDAFKDLKKDWEGLQKATAKEIFGDKGEGLRTLQGLLKTVRPLILAIADTLGDLFDQFAKFSKTTGFADMIAHLTDVLPDMIGKIGSIGGTFLVGIGRAFIAAEPIINKFLGWLQGVADAFANLGKGGDKSTLAGIFDQGARSAEILWDLISNVGGILTKLFSAGAAQGDSILEGLVGAAEDLNKWLSDPANQDTINKWFIDAGLFAGKLGEIIKSVIKFVDALDTEQSRAQLMLVLDAIKWIIDSLTWLITKWSELKIAAAGAIGDVVATITGKWNEFVRVWLEGWGQIVAGIQGFLAPIGAWFAGVWTAILGGISGFVSSGLAMFSQMGVGISTAWGAAVTFITSTLPGFVTSVISWFAQIPGRISAVLGDLAGRFQIWLAGVPQKIQSSVGLVVGAFGGLAGKAIARAGNIVSGFTKWVAGLPGKARAIATSVAAGFTNLAGKIISKAGSLASRFASWVSSLAGKARSTAVSIINGFSGLAGKIISKAGSIASKFGSWVAGLPGKAKTIAGNIASAFSGLAGKIISRAGDIASKFASWGSKAVASAGRVASNIVNKFSGLASKIVNAIGNIVPKIKMPNIPRPTVQAIVKVIKPKTAEGGIFSGAQTRIIGEAGPEAVVPLNRALNRVDPAVRALSAYAQGLSNTGSTAPSIGRQIDVGGITINTPTTDPRAVASEVVNRMTFAAYI